MRFFKKRPGLCLVPACYAAGLVLLLALHFCGFVQNRMAYQSGALVQGEVTLDDFAFSGLAQNGPNTAISLDGDPQMLLLDGGRRVESVVLEVVYAQDPLQVAVFWAAPGQPYSTGRMALAGGDGQTFYLPPGGGRQLRIDPGAVAGNQMTFVRIVLNQKRPFWAFFLFSAQEAVLLAVAPGLIACVLNILRGTRLWPKRRAKGGDAA